VKLTIGIVISLLSVQVQAGGFKSDWTPSGFYKVVELCREQEIKSATNKYSARATEDKIDADKATTEIIELLPSIDYSSSAHCYCSVNEASKVYSFSEISANLDLLVSFLNSEKCVAELKKSMTPDNVNKLRLK
jgi:hypothetical protein